MASRTMTGIDRDAILDKAKQLAGEELASLLDVEPERVQPTVDALVKVIHATILRSLRGPIE